jgi:cysteine desulfuration protein SufE
MAKTIAEKQQDIIEEFGFFEDWMQKYEYIIELGKDLPLIDEQYKTDENLIKGCQSRVWLHAVKTDDNRISFSADSDAIITKGIINILVSVFNNEKGTDIAQADMSFIDSIGLKEHLSPTRANGLVSMMKQLKLYGIALS